jgi:hypothetical protein
MSKRREQTGDDAECALPTKFCDLLSFYDLVDKFHCFSRRNHIEFTVGVLKSFLKSCGAGLNRNVDATKSLQSLCTICGDISLSRSPNELILPRQLDFINNENNLYILLNGPQGMSEVRLILYLRGENCTSHLIHITLEINFNPPK